MECGSAYKMHYIGLEEDPHAHDHGHGDHGHHGMFIIRFNWLKLTNGVAENPYPRPKNMSDFIKPDYLNA